MYDYGECSTPGCGNWAVNGNRCHDCIENSRPECFFSCKTCRKVVSEFEAPWCPICKRMTDMEFLGNEEDFQKTLKIARKIRFDINNLLAEDDDFTMVDEFVEIYEAAKNYLKLYDTEEKNENTKR